MVMRNIARPGDAVTPRYRSRGVVGPDPRHTRASWPASWPSAGFGWLPRGVVLCRGPGAVPYQATGGNAVSPPGRAQGDGEARAILGIQVSGLGPAQLRLGEVVGLERIDHADLVARLVQRDGAGDPIRAGRLSTTSVSAAAA